MIVLLPVAAAERCDGLAQDASIAGKRLRWKIDMLQQTVDKGYPAYLTDFLLRPPIPSP